MRTHEICGSHESEGIAASTVLSGAGITITCMRNACYDGSRVLIECYDRSTV
jgi:hypothetical protein